jgi:outer membrane protein TolC
MSARSEFTPMRLRSGLSLFVLLAGAAVAMAEDRPATSTPLTLDAAVQLALQQQPAVRAARASAQATAVQMEAANSFLANLTGPQIHIRRQQGQVGVAIADAGVTQAEFETINAVTRNYLSVLYANEQLKIAEEAVANFKVIYEAAKRLVEVVGSKEVTTSDLDRIRTYQLLAETRVVEARLGKLRAEAALREAIGLAPNCPLDLGDDSLDRYYREATRYLREHKLDICCPRAVELAVRHRPEVMQADLFAELVRLEIEAQNLTMHPYARTFAATGDIHVRVLPATYMNGDYRPGAVGPEMPVYFAGSREARTERARVLYDRALSVADKTRGLVALETEEACARLQQYARQIEILREASEQTDKLRKKAEESYRADQLSTERMLAAQVLDAQTKAQLNEAIYNYGIALATLQRATGGQLWKSLEPVPAAKD